MYFWCFTCNTFATYGCEDERNAEWITEEELDEAAKYRARGFNGLAVRQLLSLEPTY